MIIYIVTNLSTDRSHLPFVENTKVFTDARKALALFREWEGTPGWMSSMLQLPTVGSKQMSYCGDTKVELLPVEVVE